MRMLNPSFAVASLVGFLTAASCTLITDVDRTRIPTDAGPSGGTGGGTGGSAGEAGSGGAGNESGAGAEGGTGGRGSAGTGGANAGTGGTSAGAGTGGSGGSSTPTETCDKATGRLTIGVGTLISSGWTFKLGDGVNNSVTFVFDWLGDSASETGANVIEFAGEPTPAEWAVLITDAINAASNLEITATTTAAVPVSGSGGAGGESGAGASGAGAGGQSGEASPPAPMSETIELKNNLAGARGNVKITETVGNPNFKVSGMSGGKAVICSSAASCTDDAECDSGRSCSRDHLCD